MRKISYDEFLKTDAINMIEQATVATQPQIQYGSTSSSAYESDLT